MRVETWSKFHRQAFSDCTPVFPIIVAKMEAVAALFKAGQYRSFDNYLSNVRSAYIERGGEWTQALEVAGAWVARCVNRGKGPARQSVPWRLRKLSDLPRTEESLAESGPLHPQRLALIATMFLLREIELSAALLSDVKLNMEDMEVS